MWNIAPWAPVSNVLTNCLSGKTVVNFGDSIFGNFDGAYGTSTCSISTYIARKTDSICKNGGFGGCRMSYRNNNKWDPFAMYAIADSIYNDDWSIQENAIANDTASAFPELPGYFADRVAMLKELDWSTVDIVTIACGVNDFGGDTPIKATDGTFTNDYEYYEGALSYAIEKILSKYPHIRIVICTPLWRFWEIDGTYQYCSDDEQSKNEANYLLTDYVKACKNVAEKYHILCVDNYYELGVNKFNRNIYFTATDGVHPNVKGRQIIGERIASKIMAEM